MLEPLKAQSHRFVAALAKYPASSFLILLVLLFGIIALGHTLRAPEEQAEDLASAPKETLLFQTGSDTAFVTVPAKVKKESVVQITALTTGIVTNITATPGRTVTSGQTIMTLTADYQSGSAELGKKLAAENARLTEELARIDKRISSLEEKKIKKDSSLSSAEEDFELEQLKREKAERKSSLVESSLSLQISNLSDAALKPKAFANGTIQSIRVNRGDLVKAGDVLATISVPKGATTIEAMLDQKTTLLFDATKESLLTVGTETLRIRPTYFSKSENEHGLFPVLFNLSEGIENKIVDGEFLKITLPLRPQTDTLLIPIDAVFQDKSEAWVLVVQDGKAVTRAVTLGQLYGSFAEVVSGLGAHDQVILSRSVIGGDAVAEKAAR